MAEGTWSSEELQASVEAYAKMYRADQEGRRVNKAGIYRDLEARFGRRNKAFERRMMNISHVVVSLGGEPVAGLLPASNIGTNTLPVLTSLVIEQGFLSKKQSFQPPTTHETDPLALEEKVNSMLSKWEEAAVDVKPPNGVAAPRKSESTTAAYERSPEVKAWVLLNSCFVCECCGKDAPFKREDGTPYLEVHHVLPLAMPGILTGTIIGLAQALGETAPLLLIGMVGYIATSYPDGVATGFLDPNSAMPAQIYEWAKRADPAYYERAWGGIIILLLFLMTMTMTMNIIAIILRRRFERRW